jgi:hypothetical protein
LDKSEIKQFTQVGVSAIVLIACLILIFGASPEDVKKWASGMVGVVVGYWLR